jgi:hypothetical protein
MMYPEMIIIVAKEHQEYLRNLAKPEPLVPTFADLSRSTRHQIGAAMIRIGVLLGGTTAHAEPAPTLSFQE